METEVEKKVIEMLRKLKPYGELKISLNQDGSQYSCYLINSEKETINIKN